MNINFQYLRSFHAIASDKSVTRAARRLNISQPTLSKQLKALEERYQIKLIEGARPPLSLTDAGKELYEKTSELFNVATDIGILLGDATNDEAGTIRLGTDSPPYCAEFIAAYRKAVPNINFKVKISNAQATNEALVKAQIDIAIVCDPLIHAHYNYVPLYRDQLVAVVAVDWKGCKKGCFELSDLADETLLIREPTSRTLATINRLLTQQEFAPSNIMELHTREMIREAVAHKLGISFVFRRECPPDIRLAILPIVADEELLWVDGYLAFRTERRRLPAIAKALEIASELVSGRNEERVAEVGRLQIAR